MVLKIKYFIDLAQIIEVNITKRNGPICYWFIMNIISVTTCLLSGIQ